LSHQPAQGLVIAVDGPSGSGKSSAARGVADRLGLRYLDTGAMYRAMTWWMLRNSVDVNDAQGVAEVCMVPEIVAGTDPRAPTITVDGTDVAVAIRSREVTNAVSVVSAVPQVRARLVALQRAAIGSGGIVVEGRDIGTTVAPDAAVKVYLTASAKARAQRRSAELAGSTPVHVTKAEMARRDHLDSTRATTPLAVARDAVRLDTTELDLTQVIEAIIALADGYAP
jgi:cytidylate kinase